MITRSRIQTTALMGAWMVLSSNLAAQSDPGTIATCAYPDDAAAAADWKPMTGSAPPAAGTAVGRRAMRLRCNFAGTTMQRASWDLACNIDLADCRGIQFDVFCTNAHPVSNFSIYFESEGGWYTAPFHPESTEGWSTIQLPKTGTRTEGKPGGWSKIKTIRISAWRGEDTDTEFYIAAIRKIGAIGTDASIAIIRAESAAAKRPSEAESVERFAEAVALALDRENIPTASISDLDLTPQRLSGAKLVILPHNPSLPDAAADALKEFVARGGKLLAFFFSTPPRLRPVLDFGPAHFVSGPSAPRFSAIRFSEGALPGAPPRVSQRSWGIHGYKALPPTCRVLAEWLDEAGQPTGYPAVIATPNAILMTHVLLPDDATNKSRMLLAMLGSLVPDVWRSAARARIADVGRIAGYDSFETATHAIISASHDDPGVGKKISETRKLLASATALEKEGKYIDAVDTATLASRQLLESYCMSRKALPGEFRAFWCHSASGVRGMDWDTAIRRLSENGFTAILPNMLWGGVAFYNSRVLPVHADVATDGDQIAACLAACKKYGVQLHVWKVNWNTGHHTSPEFIEKIRAEGRCQSDATGKSEPWLCPSHPANQKLEIDSMLEVAKAYDVDGLHFDYIRYPGDKRCFCAGCRTRFESSIGARIAKWPADVGREGPHNKAWLEWRRSNITTVVKAVSEGARAIRPGIRLSAAVFRNWPRDRDSVGQDWKVWCDLGYLDFVCPMDYTPSNAAFKGLVQRQLGWTGKVPCYPGIGVSTWTSPDPIRTIAQIEVARALGCRGFTIFNYSVPEANELVPLLGAGITRKSEAAK